MGQKTHPLGFRLGITQKHKSIWYAHFDQYSKMIEEDFKIRSCFHSLQKKANISNIEVNRNGLNTQIYLNIQTAKPGVLVGENGLEMKNLLSNLQKVLFNEKKITLNIVEVDCNASLIADLIIVQLEKRVAFRRAIRNALKEVQKKVKGIKIQVSGRLNGAEIARSEWIREGRVPLQTLRAEIDYAAKEASTIYGILGVKVWLFNKEIITK